MAGTPDQIAQDWANRLGASRDKIQRGIESVTVAPGQAAARQADTWANNTAAAKDKFRRNVAAVGLADWQGAMVSKGLDRVASGATAAVPKMTQFLTKLLPAIQQIKSTLPARGTYEQNKQRAIAMMDGLHKQSFK